ncbi:MAG TPA: YidB family protein [Roseiarcus sp.]|nr:YidB family protein [Roseiarcus sp.]
MGMFDDAMKNAVPGGNLATPIAVAVGALILGKLFGGSSTPSPSAPPPSAPPASIPTNVPPGSLLGGLSDLIGKLTAGGAAPQVNSWVGPGENQPIQPGQLGGALGQNTLNELSQRTGMSQQELLQQLSLVLPQLINNLTPKGRMPTVADLEN